MLRIAYAKSTPNLLKSLKGHVLLTLIEILNPKKSLLKHPLTRDTCKHTVVDDARKFWSVQCRSSPSKLAHNSEPHNLLGELLVAPSTDMTDADDTSRPATSDDDKLCSGPCGLYVFIYEVDTWWYHSHRAAGNFGVSLTLSFSLSGF